MSKLPRAPGTAGSIRPPATGMTLPSGLGNRSFLDEAPSLPAFTQRIQSSARRATLTTATFTPPPDSSSLPPRSSGIAAARVVGGVVSPSPSVSSDSQASQTLRTSAPLTLKDGTIARTHGHSPTNTTATSALPAGQPVRAGGLRQAQPGSPPHVSRDQAPGGPGRSGQGPRPGSAAGLRCGTTVFIPTQALRGTLRYLGPIDGKPGMWAGVELDEAGAGKNDGTVAGKAYFSCPPSTGIFVAPSKIEPGGISHNSTAVDNGPVLSISTVLASSDKPLQANKSLGLGGRAGSLVGTPSSVQRAHGRQGSRSRIVSDAHSTGSSGVSSPVAGRRKTLTRPPPATISRGTSRTRPLSTTGSAASNRTSSPSLSRPNSRTLAPAAKNPGVAAPTPSRPLSTARPRVYSGAASPDSQSGGLAGKRRSGVLASGRVAEATIRPAGLKPKPKLAADSADRLRLRIDMLEAENRVLRLKGEQDKAHIAASQMLAKDLAAANGSGSPSARSGAASSDSSLQQLSDARGALERERKASKTKIDQLQAQIRELHACRSTDDAATSLGGEQAVAELQIKLRNAAEAHSKELEVARAAYAELATKLDQRTAAAAELQATVDAKSSEVDALSERLEHRSSELKRAMQRYHELVEEREQKHGGEPPEELEQIPVLEKQVEKLRRELADSESQRLTLAADLESAVGAQAAAEAVAAAMQSKVEQAGLAAAGHDQALTLLADCRSWSLQLIEALAKSAGDDASDDSYSGAAGSDPLQVLPGLFEQSQLLATRLADRLSDATQRAAALAADVQAKDEAISGLQAGADTCSGAQAGSSQPGRSEQIEELERQNAALIAERDEFNRENGMLTDYLGKLESECNRLVDDIEQLNSENQKLAEELRVASLQNSTVSLDIGALDGNAFGEIPDASMDDLRQRYTHEMAALKLQMDELQKRKDKEISSLQDEIASLEAMVEDKVFGESDLNDQIASLTSELNRLRIGQANAPRAGPSASPASADATAAAAVADDGTVYCEICESSDHDIADCPAVTSTATMFKQEASIDSSRPYCDNCEVFSHWTESCPHGDEMF